MSISGIAIKIIGVILAVVGLALILAAVGINLGLGAHLDPPLVEIVVGAIFLAVGSYIALGYKFNP